MNKCYKPQTALLYVRTSKTNDCTGTWVRPVDVDSTVDWSNVMDSSQGEIVFYSLDINHNIIALIKPK
jgi:hypothetical protein